MSQGMVWTKEVATFGPARCDPATTCTFRLVR